MKPQKKATPLTPEEQAAYLAAQKLAAEEREKERQRVELYGKSLGKMTDHQVQKELKKVIRREYSGKPPAPQAGLTIALATILSTVLENTKTDQNPNGRLHSYPR
jgi:CRISPR/Cas system endoribonuclease Cas6 (RAMP superfamily)